MDRINIPDFPGYTITPDGEVTGKRGRPLTPETIKGGYRRVSLRSADGRRRHMLVHRLVMLTFVGPCPHGQEVNHRNGCTDDNRLTNLEYKTPSANVLHSFQVLGRTDNQGAQNSFARLTDEIVLTMRAAHASGLNAAEVGRRFDVDPTHAWRIVTRRSWRHLP